jgi:hypothetical protein
VVRHMPNGKPPSRALTSGRLALESFCSDQEINCLIRFNVSRPGLTSQ